MELIDQACDVVDVTAGQLRDIHVRYLTRCEVRHAFGFACTDQIVEALEIPDHRGRFGLAACLSGLRTGA